MGKRELITLLSIFLASRDRCVAPRRGGMGLSAVVIVVFSDHSHLLLLLNEINTFRFSDV